MRLNDFGLFVLLALAIFGYGYQTQEKYEVCKETGFVSGRCKLEEKAFYYEKEKG